MDTLISTQWPVVSIMQDFFDGKIAVPEIQRDVVWKAEQVKKLIDSIHEGYPCGSLILWEPRLKDKALVRTMIRPERLKQFEDRVPTYFLLDGQQRLTSLAAVTFPRDLLRAKLPELEEEDMPTMLYGHLRRFPREIEATDDGASYKFPWVLLNRLFDGSLIDDPDFRGLNPDQRKAVEDYTQRIRNYQFPIQIIRGQSYAVVGEIFSRVNSQGTPLTGAEIYLAKIVPHWHRITKEFRDYRRELRQMDYEVDLTFLMRAVTVIECDAPQIKKLADKVSAKEINAVHLNRTWRAAKKATNKIVRLLQTELGLDKTKLFTSKNVLVPLVYYAASDKSASLARKDVLKFFLCSQLSEHYSAASETRLRGDLKILTRDNTSPRRGLAELADSVAREAKEYYRGLKIKPDDVSGPPSKNVMLLMMYIVMRQQKATDFGLETPRQLDEIHSSVLQLHHIFPLNFMMTDKSAIQFRDDHRYSNAEFREIVNDLANLTFISKDMNVPIRDSEPWEYLKNQTNKAIRRAHFIPENPALWRPERFDEFLNERRRLLSTAMNALISSLM
jgi:hypothetical protein